MRRLCYCIWQRCEMNSTFTILVIVFPNRTSASTPFDLSFVKSSDRNAPFNLSFRRRVRRLIIVFRTIVESSRSEYWQAVLVENVECGYAAHTTAWSNKSIVENGTSRGEHRSVMYFSSDWVNAVFEDPHAGRSCHEFHLTTISPNTYSKISKWRKMLPERRRGSSVGPRRLKKLLSARREAIYFFQLSAGRNLRDPTTRVISWKARKGKKKDVQAMHYLAGKNVKVAFAVLKLRSRPTASHLRVSRKLTWLRLLEQ